MSKAPLLLAALASLAFAGCERHAPAPEVPANATRYGLRGTVVGVKPAAREVVIKHEEIPGYMHAMTMPFYVRDEAELHGIAPGDRITGDLLVWERGARLINLRKSPERP